MYKIVPLGGNVKQVEFKVINEKTGSEYYVTVVDGRVKDCSCPHHLYRRAFCKHMALVSGQLAEFSKKVEDRKLESVKKKLDGEFDNLCAHDLDVLHKILTKYKEWLENGYERGVNHVKIVAKILLKHQTQFFLGDIEEPFRFEDCGTAGEILHKIVNEGVYQLDDVLKVLEKREVEELVL